MADALEFIEMLPTIIFWTSIIGSLILILSYGSIAKRGYKGKLPFRYSILLRFGLGGVAFLASLSLARYLPIEFSGLLSLLSDVVALFIAGLLSAIVLYAGLRLCFHELRDGSAPVGGSFIKQLLTDKKKLAGFLILVIFIAYALVGFALIRTGVVDAEVSVMGPLGGLTSSESVGCLGVRTILTTAEEEIMVGDNRNFEEFVFVEENNPGHIIVAAEGVQLEAGNYTIVVLIPDSENAAMDESAMLEAKFCSVNSDSMELCQCVPTLQIADLLMGLVGGTAGGQEQMVEAQGAGATRQVRVE